MFLESASVSASNCVFTPNIAFGGDGGPGGSGGAGRGAVLRAITSNVSMHNCHMESNITVGGSGGNAAFFATITGGGVAEGGAIYCSSGSLILTDCRLNFNRCIPGYWRRLGVNYGTAEASGGAVTVTNGTVLTLTRCVFKGNVVRSDLAGTCSGGAIYANPGQITLNECDLSENRAEGGRYGPGNITFGNASIGHGYGGAVHIQAGHFFASNSTFRVNSAIGGMQAYFDSLGGDAFGGALLNRGTGVVENCTFAANLSRGGDNPGRGVRGAGGSGLGGAIYNGGGLSLMHATIASNTAKLGANTNRSGLGHGGGIYSASAVAELRAVVLSGNTESNFFGSLLDHGDNLSSDASCPFTDGTSISNIDPVLGPLGDYGGPTPTMPLLSGSPAIDRVISGGFPVRDQRGRARPYGAACDAGAFESSAPFTIRGRIAGLSVPVGVEVSNGITTVATGPELSYRFDGLAAGTYVITPSPVSYLTVPTNRTVFVETDVMGVDFLAYRWNSFFIERTRADLVRLVYAGTNGNTVRVQVGVQSTKGLPTWQDYTTNTVPADGLVELQVSITGNQRLFRAVIP